jgi:hypothetical protein
MQAVQSGAVVQVAATESLPPSPRRPVGALMSYKKQVVLGGHNFTTYIFSRHIYYIHICRCIHVVQEAGGACLEILTAYIFSRHIYYIHFFRCAHVVQEAGGASLLNSLKLLVYEALSY